MTFDPNDPQLRSFASARQLEFLDALATHGSQGKTARALGINVRTLERSMGYLRRRAALQGYSPEHGMTKVAPHGFAVKGVSTYFDAEGKQRGQWVKTREDRAVAEQIMRDFVRELTEDIRGKARPVPPPKLVEDDLLVVYPMGDPHFGMYAWADETGDDFDLEIADRITRAAIDRLVEGAPRAKTAVIAELGDFFHADNNLARTPQSGNPLDVDSRWYKVMQVGRNAMRYVIERALAKHERVVVRIVQGNHDTHAAIALALIMDAYFEGNPRVTIDTSPAPRWYYRHGDVLLGVTHGDTCKPQDLPAVMADERASEWGATKFRHWLRGHVHHTEAVEYRGCIVESFRTLAPRDAWHAAQGYKAGRDMTCITYHAKHGEIGRQRCDITMIEKEGAR